MEHQFTNTDDDSLKGGWLEHGKQVCSWFWDSETKTLHVTSGLFSRSVPLPGGPATLTVEKLRERLPEIALSTARELQKGILA